MRIFLQKKIFILLFPCELVELVEPDVLLLFSLFSTCTVEVTSDVMSNGHKFNKILFEINHLDNENPKRNKMF